LPLIPLLSKEFTAFPKNPLLCAREHLWENNNDMEAARYSTGWLKTVPPVVPVARFLISPLVSRAAYCVERRGKRQFPISSVLTTTTKTKTSLL
jgi:hypothetical protein